MRSTAQFKFVISVSGLLLKRQAGDVAARSHQSRDQGRDKLYFAVYN